MAVVSGGNLKQPEIIWADCSHLTSHMQIWPKADTGEMTADLWPSDDEPSDITELAANDTGVSETGRVNRSFSGCNRTQRQPFWFHVTYRVKLVDKNATVFIVIITV